VERTGARLGIGLKEGQGPTDLKEYFRLASEGMYLDSLNRAPSPDFVERFQAVQAQVEHYFVR
jgi:hypothetical protein